MTVKDIVAYAATLLKIDLNTNDQDDAETRLFVRVVNLVLSEMATDYVPLYTTQRVKTEGGRVAFTDLRRAVIDIKSVHDASDGRIAYRVTADAIETDASEVVVIYTYLPVYAALEDTVDYASGRVNERLLSYGVASEYCLISGMYDEAAVWDARFKAGLKNACMLTQTYRIPGRVWL